MVRDGGTSTSFQAACSGRMLRLPPALGALTQHARASEHEVRHERRESLVKRIREPHRLSCLGLISFREHSQMHPRRATVECKKRRSFVAGLPRSGPGDCARCDGPADSIAQCLPRAVVEVRVPRGPGAVEGERQLLVVLVLLTPHPKGGEHLDLHVRAIQDQHDWSATQAAGRKERACAPGLVPFTHGTGRRPSQAVHRRKRQVSARAVRLACRPPPHASSRRLCARLKMGRGRTRGGQGAWDVQHTCLVSPK